MGGEGRDVGGRSETGNKFEKRDHDGGHSGLPEKEIFLYQGLMGRDRLITGVVNLRNVTSS